MFKIERDASPMHTHKRYKKVVFVASLSFNRWLSGNAYSEGANQVQLEIAEKIANEVDSENVDTVSMMPIEAFPRGLLFSRGIVEKKVRQIGFLNLPLLKHFTFSLGLFFYLVRVRPDLVVIYNSFFFQNLVLRIYKFLWPEQKIAIFVQDVLPVGRGFRSIQRFLDKKSLSLTSAFDLVLPISEYVTNDFNITAPSLIIRGGITKKIIDRFSRKASNNKKIRRVVFAGALESHNGVDRLINIWPKLNLDIELHVFGKGSLESKVLAATKNFPKIKYHGFIDHDAIQAFVADSEFVIVLRYDSNIESKYFFPSKFWEAMASHATVICNAFICFPDDLKKFCLMVDDDLSNLGAELEKNGDKFDQETNTLRRNYVIGNCTWAAHIKRMLSHLE